MGERAAPRHRQPRARRRPLPRRTEHREAAPVERTPAGVMGFQDAGLAAEIVACAVNYETVEIAWQTRKHEAVHQLMVASPSGFEPESRP